MVLANAPPSVIPEKVETYLLTIDSSLLFDMHLEVDSVVAFLVLSLLELVLEVCFWPTG